MTNRRVAQVTALFTDLAARFDMVMNTRTALFDNGGEGFSVSLRLAADAVPFSYSREVIAFYFDEKYGPRFVGKAGASVPAHLVVRYVTAVAEDPTRHAVDLNCALLEGRAGR